MLAIIVCGAPAAGKSTHARKLAVERHATLLDIDTVTGVLVETGLAASGRDANDRDSAYFKATYRDPIYQTLFDIARENLGWGDVVIVGPFTRELQDATWPQHLAKVLGAEVEIHFVHCPPGTRKLRMQRRALPRDLAKLERWEDFIKYYGDEHRPAFPHVFVDTSSLKT